ncbi:MAG: TPM domain-containing protein, partial [Desulfobacterales bacterium]|nr:TPM domain-containing protein [Desulfobacterales bacterium]
AFIAVGYGLEPAIPDAIAKRIVDNEMIPHFKSGNYYQGIDRATTVLMKFAAGEISAEGYKKKTETSGIFAFLPFIIIIIIILMIRGSRGRSQTIGHSNTSFWSALMLGSMMGNSSHSGSWGGFSGGSSGFGGGGGFGGFGGGSFGGGGAGGSW